MSDNSPDLDGARVEVRTDASLSERERAIVMGRRAEIDYQMPGHDYVWAPKEWRALVWVGDDVGGHAGIVRRTVDVGGQAVLVGGISGVWTPAAYRGRGLGAAVVRAAAAFARDELRVDFGLLLCREGVAPFYGRLGWRAVSAPVVFDQPGGRHGWDMLCLILPCARSSWPPGPIDLRGLPW